jgi:hypothetical protein
MQPDHFNQIWRELETARKSVLTRHRRNEPPLNCHLELAESKQLLKHLMDSQVPRAHPAPGFVRCVWGHGKMPDADRKNRSTDGVAKKQLARFIFALPQAAPQLPMREHLPNQFRRLFALAKCWHFYTLVVVRGLSKGSLVIPA